MQQEPVVGLWDVGLRDISDQLLLHLQRRVRRLGHQTEAVAHTEYMRVDSHRGTPEGYGLHHISRFATYARQPQ